jgi:thiol-disulfide isomerase/thioredoxin
MDPLAAPRPAHYYRYRWLLTHGGTLLAACLLLTGCGNVNMNAVVKTLLGQPDGVDNQAADSTGLDAKSLEGKSLAEVKATLGVPQGKLRTQDGEVWLYSEWRVQFDEEDVVRSVQPETAVKLQPVAEATAARKARPITVVAKGGQQVDLRRLMPPGKVTIVDFYADWCGPCRQVSPHLERLASSDPDVVLVKVDIVNWGTPVTRQFGINSVPNIRVFDRRARAIGQPTSNFNAVQRYVRQAKKI